MLHGALISKNSLKDLIKLRSNSITLTYNLHNNVNKSLVLYEGLNKIEINNVCNALRRSCSESLVTRVRIKKL